MIELEGVGRDFGALRAVDGVSFRIGAGEIVGFLGANGAGKSTVLRMLSTYLRPTRGRLSVAGLDVQRQPLRARAAVGYLTEHNALFDAMRVDRFLTFMARARGLAGPRLAGALERVRGELELAEVWTRPVSACSKGYRQRIGLAAALVHDPPVLLLDEPTHGLDPLQVAALREVLQRLRAGRAILFSSHVLAEVTHMADRLLLMHRGRLVLDASVESLREEARAGGRDLEQLVLERLAGQGVGP